MIELIPESYVAPLDLVGIFGRIAPLQVDLGCGDGAFLVALAQRHPEKNFLGIERMVGRVAKTCSKAAKLDNLSRNIRVLHLETSYAVRYLLREGSVEAFYLLFPDPWPKRRHRERRVVTPEFLQAIGRALAPDGNFYLATDQRDYFEQMQRLAQSDSHLENSESADVDLPVTKFQRRFEKEGAPIYRLTLRKVSPVR